MGRGTGGPNVAIKMKMVTGYLLSKLDKDHNLYREFVPHLYKHEEVDFEKEDMVSHDLLVKATNYKKPASRLMKAKLAAAKVDKQFKKQAHGNYTRNTSIKEERETG